MITFSYTTRVPDHIYRNSVIFDFRNWRVLPPQQLINRCMTKTAFIDYLSEEDEVKLDIAYAQYLLSGQMFYEFFKPISRHCEALDVIIMIPKTDYYVLIADSIMKLLQQRYGILCNIINEDSDWDYRDFTDARNPVLLFEDNERYIKGTIPVKENQQMEKY